MLIQNVNSMTQAPPPARPASDGAPNVAVAANSNVATQANVATLQPAVDPQKKQPASEQKSAADQLKSVVEDVNKALKQSNKNLEFSVDESSKKPIVKLVDSETGDVIRQFPSEEMLAISKAVGQMQERLQQASLQQAAFVKGQTQSAQGVLVKQQA